MKLKGKSQDFSGRSLIIPVLGLVEFDKNGHLNVDDDAQAKEVIEQTKGSIDLISVDDVKAPKKESKPAPKKEEEESEETDGNGGEGEEEEETEDNGPSAEVIALGEKIEAATTEQLLEMAKESGLGEKAAGMTDRRLKNALLKQIGLPTKPR